MRSRRRRRSSSSSSSSSSRRSRSSSSSSSSRQDWLDHGQAVDDIRGDRTYYQLVKSYVGFRVLDLGTPPPPHPVIVNIRDTTGYIKV